MKKIFFVVVLFTVTIVSYGQSIQSSLVSNGGVVKKLGDLRTEWSIGEVAVQNYTDNGIKLSEGFHQLAQFTTSVFNTGLNIEITVFPNPTQTKITINYSENETLDLEIYDLLGTNIGIYKKIKNQKSINMTHLKNGTYLLKFKNNKGQFNIYKLIKI